MCARYARQCGITLIELIVFIVIVSVALSGVLSVLNITVKSSADPLQPKQALAIAEGMLEEVLLKGYCDPDAAGTDMNATPPTCGINVVEANRILYDSIDDYHNFHLDPATTLSGSHTAPGYVVDITVQTPMVNTLPAKEVSVTVKPPSGSAIVLHGYRMNY